MDEKLKSIVKKMMEDGASQESIEGVISAYKNRLQQSDTESGKPNVVAKEDVTVTTEENLASGDGELQLANPFDKEYVPPKLESFGNVNSSVKEFNPESDLYKQEDSEYIQESGASEFIEIKNKIKANEELVSQGIKDYESVVKETSLEDYLQINVENEENISNISPESFNTYEVYSKENQNLKNKKNELSIVIADKSESNDYNKLDELSEAYSDLKLYKPEVAVKLRPLYLKAEKRIVDNLDKNINELDISKFVERNFDGFLVADDAKISDAADSFIGENNLEDNVQSRKLFTTRLRAKASNYEVSQKLKSKIKSNTELSSFYKSLEPKKLDHLLGVSPEALDAKVNYTFGVDFISESTTSKLEGLSQSYLESLNKNQESLQVKYNNGSLSKEQANQELLSLNKTAYDLHQKRSQDLISKYNIKQSELLSTFNDVLSTEDKKYDYEFTAEEESKLQGIISGLYSEVSSEMNASKKESRRVASLITKAPEPIIGLIKDFNNMFFDSVSNMGRAIDSPGMAEFGNEMKDLWSPAYEPMDNWDDLYDPTKVMKSVGRLMGSAAPGLIAAAGVSIATGGLGTLPTLALVSTTGWLSESMIMAGNMERMIMEETGSAMKAKEGVNAMWNGQIKNMWTYAFDGIPFIGKTARLGGPLGRVLISGGIEAATETPQEVFQTAQEEQIMESVRSGGRITEEGFMGKINPKMIKSTVLEVGWGSLVMGGGSRFMTESSLKSKQNQIIAQINNEVKINKELGKVDIDNSIIKQKILSSVAEYGKNFTNTWLGSLMNAQYITSDEFSNLSRQVDVAQNMVKNKKAIGNLTNDQFSVYSSIINRVTEAENKAEEIKGDPVAKSILKDKAKELKLEAKSFLENPSTEGRYVTIKTTNKNFVVLDEQQATKLFAENPELLTQNIPGVTVKFSKALEGSFVPAKAEVQEDVETEAGQTKESAMVEVNQYIESLSNTEISKDIVSSIEAKMNNADFIKESELDAGVGRIFDEIDRVENLNISQDSKSLITKELYETANKLNNYEFRTKTVNKNSTDGATTEGSAKTKREIPKKETKADVSGVESKVVINNDNTLTITETKGSGVTFKSVKYSFPEEFVFTDENGSFTAIELLTDDGRTVSITDPNIGIPMALNRLMETTEDVTTEQITEEINFIQESVAEKKTKPIEEVSSSKPKETETESKEVKTQVKEKVYPLKNLEAEAANAQVSLSVIAPDVKIVIAKTEEEYKSLVKESADKNSGGTFSDKTIFINPERANKRTIAHEVFHAVLLSKGISDAQASTITRKMLDAVSKTASPKLLGKIAKFSEKYEKALQSEESIAELVGILASNLETIEKSNKGLIKRWLDKLAKLFGLKPFTDAEVINLLNTISDKVAIGQEITKKDIKIIKGSKSKESQSVRNQEVDKKQQAEIAKINKLLNPNNWREKSNDRGTPRKRKLPKETINELINIKSTYTPNVLEGYSTKDLIALNEFIKEIQDLGKLTIKDARKIKERLLKDKRNYLSTIIADKNNLNVSFKGRDEAIRRLSDGNLIKVGQLIFSKKDLFEAAFPKGSVVSGSVIFIPNQSFSVKTSKKGRLDKLSKSFFDLESFTTIFAGTNKTQSWLMDNIVMPASDKQYQVDSDSNILDNQRKDLLKESFPDNKKLKNFYKNKLREKTGIILNNESKNTASRNLTVSNIVYLYNVIKMSSGAAQFLDSGYSMSSMNEIVDYVNSNSGIKKYADGIVEIYKGYLPKVNEAMSAEGYEELGISRSLTKEELEAMEDKDKRLDFASKYTKVLEKIYGKGGIPLIESYSPTSAMSKSKTDEMQKMGIFEEKFSVSAFAANSIEKKRGGVLAIRDNEVMFEKYVNGMTNMVGAIRLISSFQTMFSKRNLSLIEDQYGKGFKLQLQNTLNDVIYGSAQSTKSNESGNPTFTRWLNQANAAIMFLNITSMLTQPLSSLNYAFENDIDAADYMKNIATFRSKEMVKAREELTSDPSFKQRMEKSLNSVEMQALKQSEFADVSNSEWFSNGLNTLLQKGYFLTTQADAFAIAFGGTAFYKSKTDELIRGGMPEKEAKAKAIKLTYFASNKSQQASSQNRISADQKNAGMRMLLGFKTTSMQYNRIMFEKASDIRNGRGNLGKNLATIAYYGGLQSMMFHLVKAILSSLGDDEDEDNKILSKTTANRLLDSFLAGFGVYGVGAVVLKNLTYDIVEYVGNGGTFSKEAENILSDGLGMDFKKSTYGSEQGIILDAIKNVSPSIGYKASVAVNSLYDFNQEKYYSGFTKLAQAGTSVPFSQLENISDAFDSKLSYYERLLRLTNVMKDYEADEIIEKSEKRKARNNSQNTGQRSRSQSTRSQSTRSQSTR